MACRVDAANWTHTKQCGSENGLLRCTRHFGHQGFHHCHVRGECVGTWKFSKPLEK